MIRSPSLIQDFNQRVSGLGLGLFCPEFSKFREPIPGPFALYGLLWKQARPEDLDLE